MAAFDALDVLLQVGDGAALDVGEYLVLVPVLAQQPLQVPVELANADDQPGQMPLDLGELDMDAGIDRGGRRATARELAQVVADGVEHRRLQTDRLAQRVQGVQLTRDRRLAAAGERPPQILALELLGCAY